MAAPIVPLKAGEAIAKAVTGDLLVLHGKVFRKVIIQPKKRKSKHLPQGQQEIFVLEPIEIEAHINPLAIGIGAAALAVGALVGWVAWNGIVITDPLGGEHQLIRGIRGTSLGDRVLGALPGGTAGEEAAAASGCKELEDAFSALRSFDNFLLDFTSLRKAGARVFWDEAQRRGCSWTTTTGRP